MKAGDGSHRGSRELITRGLVVAVLVLIALFVRSRSPDEPKRPSVQPDSSRSEPAARSRERTPVDVPIAEEPGTPLTESDVPSVEVEAEKPAETRKPAPPETSARDKKPDWIVRNVTIRDRDGEVLLRGDVDLEPTLKRIERGERHAHRNDGSVFQNREGRLPRQPRGYYREYVHPTPGDSGPGPQRIVLGREGEVFYTHDHYRTFRRLR